MLFSHFNNPTLEVIAGTECIGDSLYKINTNTTSISSFMVNVQQDIVQTWEQLQSDVVNAEAVLNRVQVLSAQTSQWDTLYSYVVQSSASTAASYDLALSAVSSTALLSTLRGNNAVFVGASAVNLTATNIKGGTTITSLLSCKYCAIDSISATGYYYGDGSKLIGIVAPTRVYVRFNGSTLNLPDLSQLPTGYWGTFYNVTSITKMAVGTYRINFARSIEDYRYAYFICSGGGTVPYVACRAPGTNASVYDITVLNKRLSDNVTVDAEEMNVMVLYPEAR